MDQASGPTQGGSQLARALVAAGLALDEVVRDGRIDRTKTQARGAEYGGFRYVSAEEVFAAVRGPLYRNGVAMLPSCGLRTDSVKAATIASVTLVLRHVSGEEAAVTMERVSAGNDAAATTQALKACYLHLLCIPCVDEPTEQRGYVGSGEREERRDPIATELERDFRERELAPAPAAAPTATAPAPDPLERAKRILDHYVTERRRLGVTESESREVVAAAMGSGWNGADYPPAVLAAGGEARVAAFARALKGYCEARGQGAAHANALGSVSGA